MPPWTTCGAGWRPGARRADPSAALRVLAATVDQAAVVARLAPVLARRRLAAVAARAGSVGRERSRVEVRLQRGRPVGHVERHVARPRGAGRLEPAERDRQVHLQTGARAARAEVDGVSYDVLEV